MSKDDDEIVPLIVCGPTMKPEKNPGVIQFTVPGIPKGKGRPRFARVGKFVQTYTDDKTASFENKVWLAFKEKYPGHKPFIGVPIRIEIRAFFPIPKSTPKKWLGRMIAGIVHYLHKPDWDNIGKICCDALNGIAYFDDVEIADGRVIKKYSETIRAEIEIEEIKEDDDDDVQPL